MNDRLCLRCDWSGPEAERCPRCGAPLYRVATPAPTGPPPAWPRPDAAPPPARAGAPSTRRPSRPGGSVPSVTATMTTAEPPRERGRARGVAATLAVVLLAVVVAGWLATHGGDRAAEGPRMPPGLTGTLIYAVDRGDGTSRLWRWNLETGQLRRGPDVGAPIQLVDAYAANPGWVGVTSRAPSGVLVASVLRFLEPQDLPVPLLRGDRIAWDGRGMTVAALREGDRMDRCRRHVTIDLVRLATSERDRQYERGRLCGRITTLGRASLVTFFTLRRSGRTGVYFAGVRPHRILRDYTMLSVSPTSDLLVVPTPPPPDATGGAAMLGGDVSLFFRGLGDAGPIAYGTRGRPFALERVLAWTTDSLSAIVLGRSGDRIGLFVLDGGAGDGLDPPNYLGPSSGTTYAAFSQRDVGFVVDGAVLSYLRDGVLVPLPLPSDAPAPDGPIVWIP